MNACVFGYFVKEKCSIFPALLYSTITWSFYVASVGSVNFPCYFCERTWWVWRYNEKWNTLVFLTVDGKLAQLLNEFVCTLQMKVTLMEQIGSFHFLSAWRTFVSFGRSNFPTSLHFTELCWPVIFRKEAM